MTPASASERDKLVDTRGEASCTKCIIEYDAHKTGSIASAYGASDDRVWAATATARRSGKTHLLRERLRQHAAAGRKISKVTNSEGRVTGYLVHDETVVPPRVEERIESDENVNVATIEAEAVAARSDPLPDPLPDWGDSAFVGGKPPNECKNCGDQDLCWSSAVIVAGSSPVYDGRLKLHDTTPIVYQYCHACSETTWMGTFQQFVSDVLEKEHGFKQLLTEADFREETSSDES